LRPKIHREKARVGDSELKEYSSMVGKKLALSMLVNLYPFE